LIRCDRLGGEGHIASPRDNLFVFIFAVSTVVHYPVPLKRVATLQITKSGSMNSCHHCQIAAFHLQL